MDIYVKISSFHDIERNSPCNWEDLRSDRQTSDIFDKHRNLLLCNLSLDIPASHRCAVPATFFATKQLCSRNVACLIQAHSPSSLSFIVYIHAITLGHHETPPFRSFLSHNRVHSDSGLTRQQKKKLVPVNTTRPSNHARETLRRPAIAQKRIGKKPSKDILHPERGIPNNCLTRESSGEERARDTAAIETKNGIPKMCAKTRDKPRRRAATPARAATCCARDPRRPRRGCIRFFPRGARAEFVIFLIREMRPHAFGNALLFEH